MEDWKLNQTDPWRVSVIIPVFNVRPYLEEALDSVIHQTYRNLEILLIDDGSTDGSGELCDRCAQMDGRICVIHQENRGLSAARNTGLDRMTGQAVAFLDPDDAFCPDMIRQMMNAMLEKNADIVSCGRQIYSTTGKMRANDPNAKAYGSGKIQRVYSRSEALRAQVNDLITVTVWDKLYRREIWKEVRFSEGHVYEDRDIMLSVLNNSHRVSVLKEKLYLHRKRPGSITANNSVENIRDRALANWHYLRFIQNHIPEVFAPEHLKKAYRSAVNCLLAMYACLPNDRDRTMETAEEEIKSQLRPFIEAYGMQALGLKTRAAWWMIRKCPWMLKMMYPVYHLLHRLAFAAQCR